MHGVQVRRAASREHARQGRHPQRWVAVSRGACLPPPGKGPVRLCISAPGRAECGPKRSPLSAAANIHTHSVQPPRRARLDRARRAGRQMPRRRRPHSECRDGDSEARASGGEPRRWCFSGRVPPRPAAAAPASIECRCCTAASAGGTSSEERSGPRGGAAPASASAARRAAAASVVCWRDVSIRARSWANWSSTCPYWGPSQTGRTQAAVLSSSLPSQCCCCWHHAVPPDAGSCRARAPHLQRALPPLLLGAVRGVQQVVQAPHLGVQPRLRDGAASQAWAAGVNACRLACSAARERRRRREHTTAGVEGAPLPRAPLRLRLQERTLTTMRKAAATAGRSHLCLVHLRLVLALKLQQRLLVLHHCQGWRAGGGRREGRRQQQQCMPGCRSRHACRGRAGRRAGR